MKKESMKSRYKEHAGEERKMHGYHKSKHPKKSLEKFEDKAKRIMKKTCKHCGK